jgi:hypothetical protein
MRQKLLTLVLAFLLAPAGGARLVCAKSNAEKEARFTAKVRAQILKLGTGAAARVRLRLRDNTKLEGYVSEAGADSFVVKDLKTGAAMVVAYSQVKQIKGHNLSTGAKIAIGVGIAAAVLLVTYLILKAKCGGNIIFCD